ncbi:uncharacterized protein LOC110617886 [Manihot esculenta]|uniref:DUF4228 domain-containing protein n=1 Tax=Manihot esculenta TaxID=3983 RepID=A0A2C9VNJ3_MANES|nr:uncharacterized protein LOC110617886 [Manihot esculenta]OAY47222.1 hypothetical protein MANES_06G062400v8 [Manihot esculenta]
MGNYVSCTLATPLIKNSKAARVVLPTGEVRQFRHQPIKAAELMLECPNFFLVNSQSLHIGRRFSALSADEEVEFGNVYIMFPMKRVNSVATAADMAALFMAANSAAKRITGGKNNNNSNKVRVLPETCSDVPVEGSSLQGSEDGGSRLSSCEEEIEGFPRPEFNYRLSVCRSKKPMLETIKEEPVRSR